MTSLDTGSSMRYGFVMPAGDARDAAELAAIAEEHGWDGFFCWDGIWAFDVWVMLTAAAMRTERILLGTMLTPIPRKRPWDLASQTATLDQLSGGRVILAAGLGVTGEKRFWLFEEDPGRRVRAEQLDEGLAMLEQLWRGEPFAFEGRHYRSDRVDELMLPAPVPTQTPRIPIWLVGAYPRVKSMSRVARYDGWLPAYLPTGAEAANDDKHELTPEILAEGVRWLADRRASEGLADKGFDVVMEGCTPADDPVAAADAVRPWAEAGATWWLDANWDLPSDAVRAESERRLRAGPPRVDA